MRFTYKLLLFLTLILFACQHEPKKPHTTDFPLILPETSYFIKFNKKDLLNKKLPFVIDAYMSSVDKKYLSGLGFNYPLGINIFQNNSKLKGFVAVGSVKNVDSIFNGNTYTYEQQRVYESQIGKKTYYTTSIQGVLFVSNQKLLIENTIRTQEEISQIENNTILQKGMRTFDSNADINVAVHIHKLKPDMFFHSLEKIQLKETGDWQFYDWVEVNKTVLSGLTLSENETTGFFPSVFNAVNPVEVNFASLIPFSATENMYISFDDFVVFMNDLSKHKLYAPEKNSATYPYLNSLKAINFFKENSNKAILLKLSNIDDFMDEKVEKIKEFNNYDIYQNPNPALISGYFSGIFPRTDLKYFSTHGNYIILTESIAYLEKILNDIQNHSVLAESKLYNDLLAELPDQYHAFLFKNRLDINGTSYMKAQTFRVENADVFTNFVLKAYAGKQQDVIIEQVLTYSFDQTPENSPQLVYNHQTKSYNIIFQDTDNNLNFLNLKGKLLWKKELKNPIVGKIHEVDILRNHKYQYAFTTPHHWYIVDRLGRDVENFPRHFIKKITQGLSVFDYERNRKYRFGITQGKKFTLYDNKAEKVKGFKVKIEDDILYPPAHFRIGNKDFILMQSKEGNLYLLNRRGTTRIKVNQKFNTFINKWGTYQRKFVNIDDNNKLISIDLAGKIKQAKLDFDTQIFSKVKENVLAAVAGNKLMINKKIKNLDLGTYLRPQIYRYGSHKYIFVADKDNNQIYAFDEKALPIQKFPIVGKQVLDFRANKSGRYLLVNDDAGNLVLYKF